MTVRLALAWLLWIVGGWNWFAAAESSVIGSTPTRIRQAGFKMTVEIEAVGGNGYQPVYLDFESAGQTFGRDRRLSVVFSPMHSHGDDFQFDLRYAVTIPESQTQVRFPLYVPHYYPWDSVRLRIFEDGREIDSSHRVFSLSGLRQRFAKQRTSVGILVPTDHTQQDASWKLFPDVRTLVSVLGSGPLPTRSVNVARLSHFEARQLAARVQPAWVQFRLLEESKLHEGWLGYSQLDVMLIAEPALARIEQTMPECFRAITEWLAAGGTLWVYAADGFELPALPAVTLSRPPVARMLAETRVLEELNLTEPNDDSDLSYETWNGVQKESQRYSYRNDNPFSTRGEALERLDEAGHPFGKMVPAKQIAERMRVADYGLGRIVCLESEDPFPGSFQFWQSVKRLSEPDAVRLSWISRNGIDVAAGNDNYWTWLIGSVGQPPVKSFLFLNTLFVVLIGPVGYFLFRRRGRLYLLYFFAPALALLVTLSLFAYALLSDGVRTKAKVRRISWVDLDNQWRVDQSRETYYAVFGSSAGLRYSSEAMVLPVLNHPAINRYYGRSRSSRNHEIVLSPESQVLRGSYLPPRDQVQYLVTQPRKESLQLVLDVAGESATLTHQLGTTLREILIHDDQARWWRGQDVAVGEPVSLKPASLVDLVPVLSIDPDAAEARDIVPALGEVPQLQYRGWGSTAPGLQISLLENRLQNWSRNLPVGAFVATADIRPEEVAAEDAVVTGSVHVLMGQLP